MTNKEDIIKSYIFIWYIDIASMSSQDVPSYMEGAKNSLRNQEKLEDLLNGEVLEYFIPSRQGNSKLEVLEFNINTNKSFSKTSQDLNSELSDAKEKIKKIMDELNAI